MYGMQVKGLYVHIPFCVRKCSYCDFPSYSGMGNLTDEYISAAAREAEQYAGQSIDTVFIGGGTPTALSCAQLNALFDMIYKNFDVHRGAEITVEANPGTVDAAKLDVLKIAGVNRVSLGVQSFNDTELSILGRIHSADEAKRCAYLVRERFDNFNLDIMTALPGQTMEILMKTLETAAELEPTHLSCYSLIIEEGTPFFDRYSGSDELPDEDEDRDMFAALCDKLKQCGYERYEISNFAKRGFRCRHNIRYWECREYIGLGAAAHSYDGAARYYNTSDVKEYIAGNRYGGCVRLSENDKIGEFVMMGLRMTDGVSASEFERRFGKKIESVYPEQIKYFLDTELLRCCGNRYMLSARGMDVSNYIMSEFML